MKSRIARRHQEKESSAAGTWARLRSLAGDASVNLGQGFPDFTPIPEALSAAQAAIGENAKCNQYAPMGGIDSLKDALAEILSGADYVQIMQDLNEEANRLHLEALAQLKE